MYSVPPGAGCPALLAVAGPDGFPQAARPTAVKAAMVSAARRLLVTPFMSKLLVVTCLMVVTGNSSWLHLGPGRCLRAARRGPEAVTEPQLPRDISRLSCDKGPWGDNRGASA